MISNKKGLSAIIITLMMILLAIVAVGVVWVVVQNLLKSETGKVATGAACLDVNVEATKASCVDDTSVPVIEKSVCDVTLTRDAGGDEIGGVKLIFTNESADSSFVNTQAGNIATLETTTKSAIDTGIPNINKVEVVVFFTDASGNEEVCSVSNPLEF